MTAKYDARANQKGRTRAAIVEAAAALLREGRDASVAEAAAAAKVSRATAYRYFPTPESLQLEAAGVTPDYAVIDRVIDQLPEVGMDLRIAKFVSAINGMTFADEPRMRMALKVYQETWFANRGANGEIPQVREGRRMRWIAKVLAPVKKGRETAKWRRLEAAIALAVGPDAMVVMKDVCKMESAEAQETLRWAAQALLRAGIAEMQDQKVPKRR